jgi:ABC-2 type transport system ATP-binding protein
LIIGLLKPQSGSISIFGKTAERLSAEERSWLRYVPDEVILEKITASTYLSMWQSVSPNYDSLLQERLCEEFAVDPKEQFLNMTYSENKATQLIAAICARPRLLLLDEPANFMNEASYRHLLHILSELNGEGMTILLTTEKYAEAGGYSNCYAYLKDGTIKKTDGVSSPDHRWKVVTIAGGDKEVLNKYMNGYEERGNKKVCLYKEDMTKLPLILHRAGGDDFIVEETTLEEELDRDFSRWE